MIICWKCGTSADKNRQKNSAKAEWTSALYGRLKHQISNWRCNNDCWCAADLHATGTSWTRCCSTTANSTFVATCWSLALCRCWCSTGEVTVDCRSTSMTTALATSLLTSPTRFLYLKVIVMSCPTQGYRGRSPTAVQAWRPCPLWEPSPSHPIVLVQTRGFSVFFWCVCTYCVFCVFIFVLHQSLILLVWSFNL